MTARQKFRSVAGVLLLMFCLSAPIYAQPRDVNPSDGLLLEALEHGSDSAVLQLVAHGANVNARDERGNTALMRAVSRPAILRLLLTKGADVKPRNRLGDNALLWSVFASNDPRSLKLLLARGADVNGKGSGGQTALIRATINLRPDLVELLLRKHPKLELEDTAGFTALDWAEKNQIGFDYPERDENMAIIKLLRGAGAKEHLRHH